MYLSSKNAAVLNGMEHYFENTETVLNSAFIFQKLVFESFYIVKIFWQKTKLNHFHYHPLKKHT